MADKPSDDDSKVMDVSKPGKGKIVVNSRPLASPVVSETAPSGDVVEKPADEVAEEAAPAAPSAQKKVIQPIHVDASPEEADEPEGAVKEPATPTDSLPTPRADNDNPIAPEEPGTDSSDAAGVDELAKAAEAKRLASQKAKEEAEKQQQLDEMIANKKYFVPIGHGGKKGGKGILLTVVVVILLALAVGGYFYWQGMDEATGDNTSQTTQPSSDDTADEADTSPTELVPQTSYAAETITSGLAAFTIQIPKGWEDLLRSTDEDRLVIDGKDQPVYDANKAVGVKDVAGFGTDSPTVLSIFISDNVGEPVGTATDFTIPNGDKPVVGKRYAITRTDTLDGMGGWEKGDKLYDYRFLLKDGQELVVWYHVYADSPNDQSAMIDEMVKSFVLRNE